ncbi:FtsL-like putative cell division protein [Bergeyella zoohelcum]|uniref:Cell division protein FtsL n=2 Tax=Bergeyella zoohelcum TaxID=1015 RepID=K1M1Z2_9FLAO|nr:FtsL-like putative cell division protein [Bergeyella zoohelcum]EKB58307.1 hypothetical protein HMPREF9699_00603 [Bergeyella zoohelcum ATCC 43767]SUV49209.1 Uncharacterised protein [Bergeyella zoohelcum]VDH03347.1 Uncharacterised protein [Bergeyella zoohelcum]
MAKRKNNPRPKRKLTFSDILKGNFIYRDEFVKNWKLGLEILILVFAVIYTGHLAGQKIKRINTLKETAEEYKSRNAFAQSRLIKVKMESHLGKEMVMDSLMPLESHPHKLLIKIDSTHGSENR